MTVPSSIHQQARPIVAALCEVLGVEWPDIVGSLRRPELIDARTVMSGMLRERTNLSWPEIAAVFGRRYHGSSFRQGINWQAITEERKSRIRREVDAAMLANGIVPQSKPLPQTLFAPVPPRVKKVDPLADGDAMRERDRIERGKREALRWRPRPEPPEPPNPPGLYRAPPLVIRPYLDEPASRLHGGWNKPLAPKQPASVADSPQQRKESHNAKPFSSLTAVAVTIIAAFAPALGWMTSAWADQPREIISDQFPPSPGMTIHQLHADGWVLAEWGLQEQDDGSVRAMPMHFRMGRWTDDGTAEFWRVFLSEPEALTQPEIDQQFQTCKNTAIAGCCPGWVPGQPVCSNFGWSVQEYVGPVGQPGYVNCQNCCKNDAPAANPGCANKPSWGSQYAVN